MEAKGECSTAPSCALVFLQLLITASLSQLQEREHAASVMICISYQFIGLYWHWSGENVFVTDNAASTTKVISQTLMHVVNDKDIRNLGQRADFLVDLKLIYGS